MQFDQNKDRTKKIKLGRAICLQLEWMKEKKTSFQVKL